MFQRSTCWLLIHIISTNSAIFAGPDNWTHFGHTPNRTSIAVDGPNTIDIATIDWIADEDPSAPEYYIDFVGQSGPVIYENKVYAYAKYYAAGSATPTDCQVMCFDAGTGQDLWHTVVNKHILDSYSSPCIDEKHNSVIIGSGLNVYALDADTGDVLWQTTLQRNIVNASVCLALDVSPARAFITDYDGRGNQGRLYCINLDPNEPASNPYNPGDIVWSDILGGTSGNTPSYQDGVVYVTSITDPNHVWGDPNSGTVYAYNAAAVGEPNKLWQTTDSRFEGFFSGVCVTRGGFLYAANYDFGFDENNSGLCKIDCGDGSVVWVTQTEKTKSTPIVVGDMIYISGGIDNYGSRQKLQAFRDLGDSALLIWETPSSFPIGGWTHQPVYANNKLYIGKTGPGAYAFGASTDLYILDLTLSPPDDGFVVDHFPGCGSSPAVFHDCIYTIGADYAIGPEAGKLYKFYQSAALSDMNRSRAVEMNDLQQLTDNWLFDGPVGMKRSDLDLNGKVDLSDFVYLTKEWLQ